MMFLRYKRLVPDESISDIDSPARSGSQTNNVTTLSTVA